MIAKYQVINPIPIRTKPYFNHRGQLVIPNINPLQYKWYLEVARDNTITNDREYFLLFSTIKFDYNCCKVFKDFGGRSVIIPHGEFADYLNKEISARANVDVEYLESEDDYDVYIVK